jgi:hypothetical protein
MADIFFDIIEHATAAAWSYGDLVSPAAPNGKVYMCSASGTSASVAPAFSTVAGSTVADGNVEWTEYTPPGATYATSLTFSRQPKAEGGYVRHKQYLQPVSYSEGGDVYVYDKGLSARETRTIGINTPSTTDVSKLNNFVSLVRGSRFKFLFSDENGATHKAIITNANDIVSSPKFLGLESDINIDLLLLT